MNAAGVLIAFEGIDGSGKGTQSLLLRERCESAGIGCSTIGFPQYGKTPFSAAISQYLNGAFGTVSEVHPKLVSILFAADRFASRQTLQIGLQENDLVICDRYVASNMAHQAAKLPQEERDAFIRWLEEIEYGSFGLPRADLTLLLDMPAEKAQELVGRKASRDLGASVSESGQGGYTALKADIHESDLVYLGDCREVYKQLSKQGIGGKWISVPCTTPEGELRPMSEIGDEVWKAVSAALREGAPTES